MIQSPAALEWSARHGCALKGTGQCVSAIVRFYQAEWLCALPAKTGCRGLLRGLHVPVVNPAVSALSESKRFPLVLNELSGYEEWKAMAPECRDPRDVDPHEWDAWVLKGSYSNTGDQVYICGTLSRDEQQRIRREALRSPQRWVAQRRFETTPMESSRGQLFPCIGVFVVNGRAAGAYVRLSTGPVINGSALEAPLLIDCN